MDVSHLKTDQHFVVHFRKELDAALLAASWRNDPSPVAGVLGGKPWILDLDPAPSVRVLVVRYDSDDKSGACLPRLFVPQQVEQGERCLAGNAELSDVAVLEIVSVYCGRHQVGPAKPRTDSIDLH